MRFAIVDALREVLGSEFDDARRGGRKLAFEEAVTLARDWLAGLRPGGSADESGD